ncbi:MAG: hypothetical protein NWE93_06685 [Candidatus Bathyarchaeota archaeon]|nr:hypothetical protein [Candidatus Bathyarchaeota archaeon]
MSDLRKWTNIGIPHLKSINFQSLCMNLAKAESEQEVIAILKDVGLWDSEEFWSNYGGTENNFSVIGNQQSAPDSALVEKLINSVDALLMKECLRRGISPVSAQAPNSINEAVHQFFNVSQGNLANISVGSRRELARNISFVASGKKDKPCYSIVDLGEGQTPNKMPSTFLSLTKSNKLRIPFVQGKFNMGGTGVFAFSGEHNLQLIISKRDIEIAKKELDDDSRDYWGFTIVRRENPKGGRRSSTYTFLAIDGKIPKFLAESLPLLPSEYPNPLGSPLESGSFIKLYEYKMPGLKTNILLDPYYRISLLLANIALPIRFFERRKGYSGHTLEVTMSGLGVRLSDDKRQNLEDGFPNSSSISVSGQKMTCQIYVFKKGQSQNYRKDEGIIFTINGQTHGHISSAFFSRNAVGLSYLADSILIIIDCSAFSGRIREDLFMNSRDRLRESTIKAQIEEKLEELLHNHPGLRALKEERRKQELENKLEDSKPLKEVLEDILRKSPTLSALLIPGVKLKVPFNFKNVGLTTLDFKGKDCPTYFRILQDTIKPCNINRRFRVQFETDANNDYFTRETCPGQFDMSVQGTESPESILNLWNGLATLTASLPENCKVDDILSYACIITDLSQIKPFENYFKVKVLKEVELNQGEQGERKGPPATNAGKDRTLPEGLALPQIRPVRHDEWGKFGFDENSALLARDTGEQGYDFYVNLDNIHLLSEIKSKSNVTAKLLEDKYKYALVLIGLALLQNNSKNKHRVDENGDIVQEIAEMTKKLSPIILPMISYLGELEE